MQVLDVNDNGPVFEPNTYAAFVPENSPVDLTVLQVTATDLDVVSINQLFVNILMLSDSTWHKPYSTRDVFVLLG